MNTINPEFRAQPLAAQSLFVYGSDFSVATGSPAQALIGARYMSWLLDPAVVSTVRATFLIPADWVAANVEALWANTSAAAGAVRFDATIATAQTGSDLSTDTFTANLTVTAGAATTLMTTRMWSGLSIPGGALAHVRVSRNGPHVDDTLTVNAALIGIAIRRVA